MNEEEIQRLDEIKSKFIIIRDVKNDITIPLDDLYKIVPNRFSEMLIRMQISKYAKLISSAFENKQLPDKFSLELQIRKSELVKKIISGDSDAVDTFRAALDK